MIWLLHNYFMPTLNSASSSTATTAFRPPPPLTTLSPILKRYKTLIKLTLRDTTQLKQLKDDIAAALRDVEGWLAEGMVHAGGDGGGVLSWDTVSGGIDEDAREIYALEGLCDALLEKGGLSPLSKK
jgi:ribosomal biogenesis protein LAS1